MTHGKSDGLICALCGRHVPKTTKHHLVPRMQSRRNKRKGRELQEDKPAPDETVDFCKPCHNQVHALLTEKELEQSYYTIALLEGHPEMAAFLKWIRKQPGDRPVTVKSSNRIKRK
jgi:hypothetical protein